MSYVFMRLFLLINGYDIDTSPEERYRFIMNLADAQKSISFEEAVNWIKKYKVKRKDAVSDFLKNVSQKILKKQYSDFITLEDGRIVKLDKNDNNEE